MDLQSFIQSGLLETYVLGQCTPEERTLVERMVAEHAEARTELASIEKALEGYATANAVPPPAWMKGRLQERIDNEAVPPTLPSASAPAGSRLFQLLALGFALLSGFLFFQNNTLNSEKNAADRQVSELQQQIDDCTRNRLRSDTLQQVVQLLRDRPHTLAVPLNPTTGTGEAAIVYHNTERCRIAVDLATLPALDNGKYYQFWAIETGKQPAPVGSGWRDTSGWHLLPCQQNAVTLAISIENQVDGNLAPSNVFRMGNISAAGG